MTRARVITEDEYQRLTDAEAEVNAIQEQIDRAQTPEVREVWRPKHERAVARLRAAEQALERRR